MTKNKLYIQNIRITKHIDIKTFEPLYGLQIDQGSGWAYVVQDGQILMKPDRAEVENIRADLINRQSN